MDYETIIGLEVHAELSTNTKIFCNCTTEFGGEPNTHCCPICIGMPGTLPVLNKKVVKYAIKSGIATNCTIAKYSKLDRKNYFYPDLPKAYQISQYDLPLCEKGYIDISAGGKKVGIRRIHIEEDAGKLVHDEKENVSFIDYNRCGVPLIEIVTEPDIRSAEEAKVFLETLKTILQYIGVSDCKMQEGSLRCDINLSVRLKGQRELGARTEIKNINSFKSLVHSIQFEKERQIKQIISGEKVKPETRGWDASKGVTFSMRSKEEVHDYRYFSELDLTPIIIDSSRVKEIQENIPELPDEKRQRYIKQYGLPDYDAHLITSSKALADFFEECIKKGGNPKKTSNWIMGDLLKILKDRGLEPEDIPFPGEYMVKLLSIFDNGIISGYIAKKVLDIMFDEKEDPDIIVKEKGLAQISDEMYLKEVISSVIINNPRSVSDYISGKGKAFKYLMGQVMKATKGKANPQLANKLLDEYLSSKL